MAGVLHIHAPLPVRKFVHAGTCPDCKRRTRFIGLSYEWYGTDKTCLRCGRQWQDGEWCALPFMRGARQHNIAAAKKQWRSVRVQDVPRSCRAPLCPCTQDDRICAPEGGDQ